MEDLVEKISQSNLTMLKTMSQIKVGGYSISYPNLLKINGEHEVFKTLKYRSLYILVNPNRDILKEKDSQQVAFYLKVS